MLYTSKQKIVADMPQCIQNYTHCHSICVQTTAYSIQMGGNYGKAGHLESLLNCADMCRMSTDFMLRGFNLHSYICGMCAEACERCAQSCEAFN